MTRYLSTLAFWSALLSLGSCLPGTLFAQNDSDEPASEAASRSYREMILADEPVAYWEFDSVSVEGEPQSWQHESKLIGKSKTVDGPGAKESPAFSGSNKAQFFDGGSRLVLTDPGEKSLFDFTNDETLSIEAWVNPQKVGNGGYVYIIGKGRTGNKGFSANNQSWAIRLQGQGGSARLSFLFRDERNKADDHWHRWSSDAGFAPNTGWHHIAFTYTFGKPDSLKGWIDGYPTGGTWDMGKKTTVAPLVDNDEVWIASSMGGNRGSSFQGAIDELVLYRKPLTTEQIEKRCPPKPAARAVADEELPPGRVLVQIHEGVPDVKTWHFRLPEASDSYITDWLTFPEVPRKYNSRGVQIDWSNPFVLRAHCLLPLPAGEHRVLLRALNGARVTANGKELVTTPFHNISGTAHGQIRKVDKIKSDRVRKLQTGENEELATLVSDGSPVRITMEMFVGGGGKRPELGEVSFSLETKEGQFEILGPETRVALTDHGWFTFLDEHRRFIRDLNMQRREIVSIEERQVWKTRHDKARHWVLQNEPSDLPEGSSKAIDRLVEAKLADSKLEPSALIDDWSFLRRASLDIVGRVPTPDEIRRFFDSPAETRRSEFIDRMMASPEWADHWTGYWQDVLAENPNIVNPTLNNTGPFRWWIYESFLDNKPIDQFATELIRMEGSKLFGGPAGFEMATENDAPMAAKAHIVGTAFLGVEMKCARCHDAPFHDVKQRDLFALAAMLGRGPQAIPKSSTINLPEGELSSLIVTVSLKPGEKVPAEWTFESLTDPETVKELLENSTDSRETLAALVTSPQNKRFRDVIVNRLWRRYLGLGIVEPVDDWEYPSPAHPDVIDYLSRELVLSGYDLKHVARLILNSEVYQREPVSPPQGSEDEFVFTGPVRRRLSAEQLVDSIFSASGKRFHAGQMNIDVDGSRRQTISLNLGRPHRAWQFTSTSNERDRPSLSLPLSQDFVALMETLGWRSSRQDPVTDRDTTPTVLQPAILANGVIGRRFTRMSEDSIFTEMALVDQPLEQLIDNVFRRSLTRPASKEELAMFGELLREGYEERRVEVDPEKIEYYYPQTTLVSWSNHLDPEANEVKIAQEAEVRRGDPPTIRLQPDWRERMEDMLWAILNTPEFVAIP